MKLQQFIMISLALNLALAVLVTARRSPHRSAATPANSPPPPTAAAFAASASFTRTARSAAEDPDLPEATPFRWHQLEADDYRVYAANLRAVGCPEQTVVDILRADVTAAFARRLQESERAEPFWADNRQRQTQWRERAKQEAQLEVARDALLAELLGPAAAEPAFDEWAEEAISRFLLGFLPEDRQNALIALGKHYGRRGDALKTLAGGILTDDDGAQLMALYGEFRQQAAGHLTPAEIQEAEARFAMGEAIGNFGNSNGWEQARVTGAELREVMRLQNQFLQRFERMVMDEAGLDDPLASEQEEIAERQFAEALRTLLGPARFAQWERGQDSSYRQVLQVVQQQGLADEVAVQAYDLKQLAVAHAVQFRNDRQMTETERAAELAVVREDIELGLARLLGEQGWRDYQKRDGEWLKGLTATAPQPAPEGAQQ